MKKNKLSKGFLFACVLMLLLTSCTKGTADTTAENTGAVSTEAEIASSESGSEQQTEPVEDEEPEQEDMSLPQAKKPNVKGAVNLSPSNVLIYGNATENCTVKIRYSDNRVEKTKISDKYFYVQATTQKSRENVYVSVVYDGHRTSEEVETVIRYNSELNTPVIAGTDSRLYLSHTVPFHQGVKRVDKNLLEYAAKTVEERIAKVRELTGKNTKFIYIISPNPMTVYYDSLQSVYSNKQNATPASKFVERISQVDGVIAPDLREVFNEHRDEDIFFRTDTHWTELGAYYAYEAMMKEVKKEHSGAILRELDEFDIEYKVCTGGDMCGMIGASNKQIKETVPFLNAKFDLTGAFYDTKRQYKAAIHVSADEFPLMSEISAEAPTAYVMSDSYGAFLLPYIGMGFSRVTVNEGVLWNYTIDYEKISEEKPDYIIFCYTDRNIDSDLGQIFTE